MLCSFAEKLEADLATETCLASGQWPVKAAEQAVVAGRGSSLLPRTIGQKTNGMLQQALITLCSPLLSAVCCQPVPRNLPIPSLFSQLAAAGARAVAFAAVGHRSPPVGIGAM